MRHDGTGLYVYSPIPLDYWDGWSFADKALLASRNPVYRQFPELLESAKRAALAYGWEGDGEWRYAPLAPLPDSHSCEWMFGVKQQNNGSTFIVSPFALPWME